MRLALIIAAAALTTSSLSSCAQRGGDAYATGKREPISLRDEDDECGKSLVQSFVGIRANATLREEIATRSGARTVRWIEPGMAVTMDFRPDRLNVELDEDGVITAMRCG
jgi:Peptidase inhibitor I78 family